MTVGRNLVIAVDGGGTKTHCLVGDLNGRVVGEGFGGPSNHQTAGAVVAEASLRAAIENALASASTAMDAITFAYLGLSGADFPEDFALLDTMASGLFIGTPFNVVNDAWLSLFCACPAGWGAAVICGTGTNAVARAQNGKTAILRSQNYRLGNFGGGQQLTDEALHFAFRADEKTGNPTRLTDEIPQSFGAIDMEAVFNLLYSHSEETEPVKTGLARLPAMVFKLAKAGDVVCQDILVRMGTEVGAMAAGVIERAGIADMEFPVGFMGGLFQKAATPIFFDAALLRLHHSAPYAHAVLPSQAPVYGALAEAVRATAALKA